MLLLAVVRRVPAAALRTALLCALAQPLFAGLATAAPQGLFCTSNAGHTRTFLFDENATSYQELICADHCALTVLKLDYDSVYFLNLSDPYAPASIGYNRITSELFVTSHNKQDPAYLKAVRYKCEPVSLERFEADPRLR